MALTTVALLGGDTSRLESGAVKLYVKASIVPDKTAIVGA